MRAFFVVNPADDSNGPRIRWMRVVGAVAIGAALTWLAFTTAAWTYLRWGREVAAVKWIDATLPHRWDALRRAIGDHYIGQAAAAQTAKDFDHALHLYRSGLARSPYNAAGRLGLARLYVAAKRPDLAKNVLTSALERCARDRDYLRATCEFLLEFHYDDELRQASERLLALPASASVDRSLVAFYAATGAFHRGHYDRAESLLRDARLDSHPEGILLLARIDAERGHRELALLRLDSLGPDDLPSDAAYVLVGQIRRELGQSRELELNAVLRLANNPLAAAPRIAFLHLHRHRQDSAALARDIEAYLTTFARDPAALIALADFAATAGQPDLAARLERHFQEQNWPADALALLTAEACLVAGRHREGLESVRAFVRRDPETAKRLAPVLDSLQTVALFALQRPDEARLHLEHLLAQPDLRAENLRLVAQRLASLGQTPSARQLLERATTLDPLNQLALTELVRLEAQGRHFEKLPAHTRRLLSMRKPSREVLELVARVWGSDLNLLHPEQAKLLDELRPHLAPPRALTLKGGAD